MRRILADVSENQSATGQAVLQPLLARRLSSKSEELNRSLRDSVIQRTSTPNISSQGEGFLRLAYDTEVEGDCPPIPPPPPPIQLAPFPVYRDPPAAPPLPGADRTQPLPVKNPRPLSLRPPGQKIPIVVTPATPTPAPGQENLPPPGFVFPGGTMFEADADDAGAAGLSDAEKRRKGLVDVKIKKCLQHITILMEMWDPQRFEGRVLAANKVAWLEEVQKAYYSALDVFCEYETAWFLNREEKEAFGKMQEDVKTSCTDYILSYTTKMLDFNDSVAASSSSQQGSARGSSRPSPSPPPSSEETQAKKNARISVKVDAKKVSAEVKLLSDEVNKVEDYASAEDHVVEAGMKSIPAWRKSVKGMWDLIYSMEKNTQMFDLDPSEHVNAENALTYAETEMENVIEEIEFQDEARALYSLSTRKKDDTPYPTFSGLDTEDLDRFKKDFFEACRDNRVSREKQANKLRKECLTGKAKSYVPLRIDIDACMKILNDMFGDSSKITKAKLDKMFELGDFPKPESKAAKDVKSQLEWLLAMELLLKELTELAEKSKDNYCEVYNNTVLRSLKNLFPRSIHKDFVKFSGGAEEKITSIYSYIVDFRKETQSLHTDVDTGGGDKKQKKTHFSALFGTVHRNEKCRICKILEEDGDCRELYEDHYTSFPAGCPRFAQMTTGQRKKIATRAKICHHCLDFKHVHRHGVKHIDCKAFKGPVSFICQRSGCKIHFLVCDQHVAENKMKIDRATKTWSARGKVFSHIVSVIFSSPNSSVSALPDPSVSSLPVPSVPQPSGTRHSNFLVDGKLNQASERLKQLAKGIVVRDLPAGEPLFMFSYLPGKSRDLNCFWDQGCSHLMIKADVPELQLPAVMTKKGPLIINAAGDTQVAVKDEWMIKVPRSDGTEQLMLGVSCDRITAPFPVYDTRDAFKEIVNKAPKEKKNMISKLRVPEKVGSEADLLIGIYYQSVYPELIHQLPSGLFISKLRLKSCNNYNAVIGGPHSSFTYLCSNVVGDPSALMSCLVDGLKSFQQLGAPKIPVPLVTPEDIDFARMMNAGQLLEFLDDNDDVEEEDSEVLENTGFTIRCGYCGDDVPEDLAALLGELKEVDEDRMKTIADHVQEFEPDPNLHDLKTLMKAQEEGLQLQYRCPKCRSCSDCRNTSETERISLREEMEDDVIRSCVKIDFDAKKISAKLPLRGDENKFLSNNRHIALKTLDNQCAKLKTDPEGKAIIIKAFQKLIDNKFVVKYDDLDEEAKKMLDGKLAHYLPWRVVYKLSVSTPCRPVFDGSSRCPLLPDGTGGRCLNDLTMKGRVCSLDLITMLLRFTIGQVAVAGDLKMFYTSIDLDRSQWHLQRVLMRENMDLGSEVLEMVICTLIFGVRAVSALSETAIIKLANLINHVKPRLADFLRSGRFVDDLADSDRDNETVKKMIEDADETFANCGLRVKAWSVSGQAPHPDVTHDGLGVDIGGMVWMPQLDSIMVKVPPLHFGKKVRGKLQVGTQVFDGSFSDLKSFCPQKMTRRQVVSKFSSLFDPLGKLVPITAAMKSHCRMAVKETTEWDGFISPELRDMWIRNFWQMHQMRGIQFSRARIPVDAANLDLELVAAVDASTELKVAGVWARFKRTNGEYSSQLIIGRSMLAKEDSSIPKEELEALTIGSNLLWIVRRALSNWVKDYMLLSDSRIALCWTTSTKKRLSLFHRNRVNQILLNTDAEKLWFCRTDHNCADVATRSAKITESSVGPDSVWEKGTDWMSRSLEAAMEADIIKNASELRMAETEDREEYDKGLIFEDTPEILIHGHAASAEKVDKMRKRSEFSSYIIQPTRFNFRKIVRITGYVMKFIRLCKFKRFKSTEKKSFKMFSASYITWGTEKDFSGPDGKNDPMPNLQNIDVTRSLDYWYTKATAEVEEFNKQEIINKIGIKKDGILYCRSRILDGQRLLIAGEFPEGSLGREIGLNMKTPLIDRWSPIAYSVALFIHELVSLHAGYETCVRMSMEYVHIMQATSLYRQLGEDCAKCSMLRGKYLDSVFGPVSDNQLTVSPPFHIAYVDLDGPYYTFAPGHERETRNLKIIKCKVYCMVFTCPFSKLTNIQVIEGKNAECVMEGLTRMACENGMPAKLVLDQESSFMKMVRDAEVNLQDLSHRCYKEMGITVEVVPVSGHNYNGITERKIRSVQEIFTKINIKKVRLHATGLQTVMKLIENCLNSLPLGYGYGRDADNNPILKVITPNLLRHGRLNSRSLTGPIKYPKGPSEFLKKVNDTYEQFFHLWNVSYVPKLIPTPKWFKESPEIKVDDVVYFMKTDNELSSQWTIGQIDSITRSKDQKIRRVVIRYYNHNENQVRYTDRALRSIKKLFSIEDNYFIDEMAECERLVKSLDKSDEERNEYIEDDTVVAADDTVTNEIVEDETEDEVTLRNQTEDVSGLKTTNCWSCCCSGHCKLSHFRGAEKKERVEVTQMSATIAKLQPSYHGEITLRPDPVLEGDHDPILDYAQYEVDEFSLMIGALETQFDLTD